MQTHIFELPPPKTRKVWPLATNIAKAFLTMNGRTSNKRSCEGHQTKDIIEDIKQKIIVTKIDLLEISITFYFLPMAD
jgi:hypothetical protein